MILLSRIIQSPFFPSIQLSKLDIRSYKDGMLRWLTNLALENKGVPLKTVAFQKGIQELKRFGVSSQYLFEQLS